jgi:hypothetical protein
VIGSQDSGDEVFDILALYIISRVPATFFSCFAVIKWTPKLIQVFFFFETTLALFFTPTLLMNDGCLQTVCLGSMLPLFACLHASVGYLNSEIVVAGTLFLIYGCIGTCSTTSIVITSETFLPKVKSLQLSTIS